MKVDPRNDNLIVFINDELLSRDEAKISVFDSSVQGGDAVWEGLRAVSYTHLTLPTILLV